MRTLFSLALCLLSFILFALAQTNSTVLPVGSCTADIPCSNGACCNGQSGFCGFGPDFCTTVSAGGTCTSNCGALAECGPFAAAENVTCPLHVCCSQFGYCGTTAEFCGTGCQSNCGAPNSPSCGVDEQTALNRRIGYYEGWAVTRACDVYLPEQISAETLTHINFAFALISTSYHVVEMSPGDASLWARTTALKGSNPGLKVFLSIGGWSFNDPPTSNIFSDLVGSSANTQTFIASVLGVMEAYAFDGIDVDWEYPAAYDRGGSPADKANYVTFMAACRSAFGSRYGLTFTAPSSYWYLQHFDLPGLLQSADWVNVMTYDLHGTWDGTDPYIGYVVEAHTNLTEIDQAFQLFWRVGINPSQVVMGFGFYGRSFTLADTGCTSPGCPWVSGANAGPCSANSGTLMFSEIESILQSGSGVTEVLDPVAAVQMITCSGNQWVSYDDAQTFAMKMDYAHGHCLGGSMIWSVDQDDNNYNALKAIYPDIESHSGTIDETGDQCMVTECGATACQAGWDKMTTLTENPNLPGNTCSASSPALLCCPTGNRPGTCQWRGGGGTNCNPSRNTGEIVLATDGYGDGSTPMCMYGKKAFCCESNLSKVDCLFYDCTTSPSCPSGANTPSTFVSVGIRGQNAPSYSECFAATDEELEQICPVTCPIGQKKALCCTADFPYSNCHWVGTPPLCYDNSCPIGQVSLFIDPQGDADSTCFSNENRQLCCDPPGLLSRWTDFDENSGDAGVTSGESEDGNENDEAFGEIFIDSPLPQSVSELTTNSDWVISGCDSTSDQPQSVLAYCSKPMDSSDSGCAHVFIGGAEHTIVRMPTNCGKGPYARVASLTPHPDQNALIAYHQAKKPPTEPVYLLKFDYNFDVIPSGNGPVYMRADVTDLPGYWDSLVDSPESRKRSVKELEQKRWWGIFTGWLSKLNTIEQDTSVSKNFHWSDTWTIFHQDESCPGPPAFSSSLDISVNGRAQLNTRYGFYLQATVIPPSVQSAFIYFSADADAQATFTIQGTAAVQYDSSQIQFASFGFPGLYYPGLLTVGPSLVISGYISGSLSMQGNFELTAQYTFPPVNFNLGNTGQDQIGSNVQPSDTNKGVSGGFYAGVDLSGSLEAHLVPSLEFGVSVLGGALIDAEVFVRADLFVGATLTGSVSTVSALQVCINPYYGVNLQGGVTGSLLFWEASPTVWNFYTSGNIGFAETCWGSVNEKRSLDDPMVYLISNSSHPQIERPLLESGAYMDHVTSGKSRRIFPRDNGLAKRGVPYLPGSLFCPAVGTEISDNGAGTDYDPYDDLDLVNAGLEDATERRSLLDDFETRAINLGNDTSIDPHELVTVSTCKTISFGPPTYTNLNAINYWELLNPGNNGVDPTMVGRGGPNGNNGRQVYAREHVYEIQLLSMFLASLNSNTQLRNPTTDPNFCTWARPQFYTNPQNIFNGRTLVQCFQRCLPNNNGVTNVIPWLENVANGAKASAFNGNTIRNPNTFGRYTVDKQLSVIRSVAGIKSYMRDPLIRNEFMTVHYCVLQAWTDWVTQNYGANQAALIAIYTNWITAQMNSFMLNVDNGLTLLTGYFNAPQTAQLDFPAFIQGRTANVPRAQVTAANINALLTAGQFAQNPQGLNYPALNVAVNIPNILCR